MDLSLPSGVTQEVESDEVRSNKPLPTNVYDAVIQLMYLDAYASGAKNVNIVAKIGNKDFKETICISNKAGSFVYKDKQTGEDKPMVGYSQIDAFLKAVTGKGISEQTIEEKQIKIYDYEKKEDVAVPRSVFMDTVKKPVKLALQELHEEKTTKESNYQQGTGEFYEKNSIVKILDAETGQTVKEKAANAEASFAKNWLDSFKDKPYIKKAKKTGVGNAPAAGAPATTSLFAE